MATCFVCVFSLMSEESLINKNEFRHLGKQEGY